MRRATRTLLAAGALALAGCIDFVEPEGPAALQPARFSMTLRLFEDTTIACVGVCGGGPRIETGALPGSRALALAEGTLDPGTDLAADPRAVLDATVRLLGVTLEPLAVEGEIRRYAATWRPVVTDSTLLFTPTIEGSELAAPVLRWRLAGSADPDTIRVTRGDDVPLRLTGVPDVVGDTLTPDVPRPDFQLWTLTLTGPRGSTRIGADGLPPRDLRIPANFLPAAPNGTIVARMEITKGVFVRAPNNDYLVNFAAQVSLGWIVRIQDTK